MVFALGVVSSISAWADSPLIASKAPFEAISGQTIGKKLLKIRIVREPGHAAAGFVHAWLLRNFVTGFIRAVPWSGFVFTLVDVCFIFRDDRRCLHDLIAGTKVVQAE